MITIIIKKTKIQIQEDSNNSSPIVVVTVKRRS